jgi:hypothetical protein
VYEDHPSFCVVYVRRVGPCIMLEMWRGRREVAFLCDITTKICCSGKCKALCRGFNSSGSSF